MKKGHFWGMARGSRAPSVVRLAAALLLVTTISGCFYTQHEVFGLKEGLIVPGLEGKYVSLLGSSLVLGGGGRYFTVSQAQEGHDYRYIQYSFTPHDPERRHVVDSGSFRLVLKSPGVYIMQRCDHSKNETGLPPIFCVLYFFSAIRSGGTLVGFELLEPDVGDARPLARRDGIDAWDLGQSSCGLSGSNSALAHFLRNLGTGLSTSTGNHCGDRFRSLGTYDRVASGG